MPSARQYGRIKPDVATSTWRRGRASAKEPNSVGSATIDRLTSPAAVAQELTKRLGFALTAAVAGVSDTGRVSAWIAGERCDREDVLRAALAATRALAASYGDDAARAWFMSTNPDLDMTSPLVFIRRADNRADYERVVSVARDNAW